MRTPTVLVVEDERSLHAALTDYLTTAGYEVLCVGEVEEAQALLAHVEFDFVVTDLRLSPLDHGGGLLVITASRERNVRTRVVVITGCDEPEIEAEAIRLGVDLFLRNPVALGELARAMAAMHEEETCLT